MMGRVAKVAAVPGRLLADLLRLIPSALLVLVAEPLYVLLDSAIIGHVNSVSLAALAVGGTLLSVVSAQLTFLSYGTTARAARYHGAGQDGLARREGVQASWTALIVGVAILALCQAFPSSLVGLLTGGGTLAVHAVSWLRIALFGVPFILLSMAGNGWMRGVQMTKLPPLFVGIGFGTAAVLCPMMVFGWGPFPPLGLVGSAWANLVGQTMTGLLFLVPLAQEVRHHCLSLRPNGEVIRAQLRLGKDLIIRSVGFQVCFLSVSAIASRIGAEALATHHIVWQVWIFLSLVLDSVAIAAQSLIGASLGKSPTETRDTERLGKQLLVCGGVIASVLAVFFAATHTIIPTVFTRDSVVLGSVVVPWWFMVALLPLAGVLFTSDGVLLGAGYTEVLRNITVAATFCCYLPLLWLSYACNGGLVGLWSAYACFLVFRTVAGLIVQARGKWLIGGAPDVLQ